MPLRGPSEDRSERGAEGHVAALVRFGRYVQGASESELPQLYDRLLGDYEKTHSSEDAIKLSLLLVRYGTRPDALAEALTLLADACRGPGKNAEFGQVVYYLVHERYRAVTDADALAAMLTQERARSARLDAELARTRTTLKAAEQDRVALARKLEELKAIEEDQPR